MAVPCALTTRDDMRSWGWIMITVMYMSIALHIVESSSYDVQDPDAQSVSEAKKVREDEGQLAVRHTHRRRSVRSPVH